MNNQNEDSLSPPSVQREYEDPWNKLNIDLEAVKFNYRYLKSQLPPEQYKVKTKPNQLKPVMSLKTEIVQIRQLPIGSKIGYRSKEKTERDLIIGRQGKQEININELAEKSVLLLQN